MSAVCSQHVLLAHDRMPRSSKVSPVASTISLSTFQVSPSVVQSTSSLSLARTATWSPSSQGVRQARKWEQGVSPYQLACRRQPCARYKIKLANLFRTGCTLSWQDRAWRFSRGAGAQSVNNSTRKLLPFRTRMLRGRSRFMFRRTKSCTHDTRSKVPNSVPRTKRPKVATSMHLIFMSANMTVPSRSSSYKCSAI